MAPILYQTSLSPPCRAIMMVAKMIGVELQLEEVNLAAGDQFKPEILKLNPRHTIPIFKDGDLILTESRAICTYLVNKYAADNDQMYPRDPAQRAIADCFLQFDLGTLYKNLSAYYYPVYFKGARDFDETALTTLMESVTLLETYLEDDMFLMGNHPGVADISIGSSLTGLEVFGFDLSPYPRTRAYYDRFSALPGYDEIQRPGVEAFKVLIAELDRQRSA